MRTLIRGFIFGLVFIPIVIILLALIGASSIFLFIGLVRYVKNDIEKDGLKNAKSSKERISSRSYFNNWVRRLAKDD